MCPSGSPGMTVAVWKHQVFPFPRCQESGPSSPELFWGKRTFSFCRSYSLESGRLCCENVGSFFWVVSLCYLSWWLPSFCLFYRTYKAGHTSSCPVGCASSCWPLEVFLCRFFTYLAARHCTISSFWMFGSSFWMFAWSRIDCMSESSVMVTLCWFGEGMTM